MSWDYYDSSSRKDELQTELERRKKRGEKFVPVEAPAGRNLCSTFWAQAWCRHLESYADYATRLPRGRSYLRGGKVFNLEIGRGTIHAEVAGQSLYEVEVKIDLLDADTWADLKERCAGQVASMLDLLSGKLGAGVMQAVTDKTDGLFPGPKQLRMRCSCPDWADLCKHLSAVLYSVAVMFDRDPRLFFALRGVDPAEMLGASAESLTAAAGGADTALEGVDLSELFGIELGEPAGGLEKALGLAGIA